MHTTDLLRESHFYVDPRRREFFARHNGDFSGDVTLISVNSEGNNRQEITIPFEALKILVGEYIRSERIRVLENSKPGALIDLIAGAIA